MADVVLGKRPLSLLVRLYAAENFREGLNRTVQGVVTDWEPGTIVTLKVGNQSWVATLTGPAARWDVDKALVATVVGTHASIVATVEGVDDLLAVGTVSLSRG